MEVPVEHGAGQAGLLGDQLDLDVLARLGPLEHPDGGLDDDPAPRLVVREPAQTAAVAAVLKAVALLIAHLRQPIRRCRWLRCERSEPRNQGHYDWWNQRPRSSATPGQVTLWSRLSATHWPRIAVPPWIDQSSPAAVERFLA